MLLLLLQNALTLAVVEGLLEHRQVLCSLRLLLQLLPMLSLLLLVPVSPLLLLFKYMLALAVDVDLVRRRKTLRRLRLLLQLLPLLSLRVHPCLIDWLIGIASGKPCRISGQPHSLRRVFNM